MKLSDSCLSYLVSLKMYVEDYLKKNLEHQDVRIELCNKEFVYFDNDKEGTITQLYRKYNFVFTGNLYNKQCVCTKLFYLVCSTCCQIKVDLCKIDLTR